MAKEPLFKTAMERSKQLGGTARLYFSSDLQMWFMNLTLTPTSKATASGNAADVEECLRLFNQSCGEALDRVQPDATIAVTPEERKISFLSLGIGPEWRENSIARDLLTKAMAQWA